MASEMDDPEGQEYWECFIPAMRETYLGDSKDGDPQLAAAWEGWKAAKRWQHDRAAAGRAE